MIPSKGFWCLVAALFGILVWTFVDRSMAVDEAYTNPDLEIGEVNAPGEYFYDPASTPPDMLESRPAADGRHWNYERLADGGPTDGEPIEFYEVHVEYFEYEVAPGDSLWRLEQRFGVRLELIYELNRMVIDRNYARRCGEGGYTPASIGHCSAPVATLQKGMLLKIPTNIWIAPIESTLM